jgi:uncharacterized protein (DUF2235 family)
MKRLVFCFDGTWNRVDAKHSTNVVITAESVLPLDTRNSSNTAQLIYYDQGVGTGKWDQIRGGMFGHGLLENLADAYRFLIFNYTPGDEIYIFGFSRGAYTARSFAGLLSHCGVLLRRHAGRVQEAIKLYQDRSGCLAGSDEMMQRRKELSPEVYVSDEEATWREANMDGYKADAHHRLLITYLGVWDTVGALGIPKSVALANLFNKKYDFHDTRLTSFVSSARHAVAIDERRVDFFPTLWTNLAELNEHAEKPSAATDAPYQQKWFPGTHSAVGGGGDRRGLSDQALDWVLDGARLMGLALDSGRYSRIYELAPDYREHIEDSSSPGLFYRFMTRFKAADRLPGPTALHEVSMSAQKRWHENPDNLPEKSAYRPATLAGVAAELGGLAASSLGVGVEAYEGEFIDRNYIVKPGETLRGLAKRYYGDADLEDRIFEMNRDRLENPDRIYANLPLRIPKLEEAPKGSD